MFEPQSRALVHRSLAAAVLAGGALRVLACTPTTVPEPDRTATATGPGGLVQRVTLAPRAVSRGDTLRVTSTVVNTGSATAPVTVQVCGLGLTAPDGVVAADNGIRCVAFSVDVRLAPGDSVTGADHRVVTALPGRYAVRVQHLLRPALAAVGEITVR